MLFSKAHTYQGSTTAGVGVTSGLKSSLNTLWLRSSAGVGRCRGFVVRQRLMKSLTLSGKDWKSKAYFHSNTSEARGGRQGLFYFGTNKIFKRLPN